MMVTQTMHTVTQHKQKGFSSTLVLVGILVVVIAGGAYFLGMSRKSVQPTVQPSVYQKSASTEPSASPTGEITQIPLPTKWMKYQASCKSLAEHIEMYYPEGWLPKEADHIADSPPSSPTQNCEVLFGYPVRPQSFQAPTLGELATFKIQTFVDKTQSLDQRVQIIGNQEPLPKSISKININGVTWSKVDYDRYPTWLSTNLNDRFFEVHLINRYAYIGDNFDKLVTIGNSDILNNEILNRIKLLP